LRWIAAHAAELGADPRRLAVGGDSAGGNLSAVAALEARELGIALRAQVLIYPSVDLRRVAPDTYPSRLANRDVPPLNEALMTYFRSHYLRDPGLADDWRLSPMAAADKAGVAPALVIVAERDMLHDDGLAYAAALRDAGVAVEVVDVPGMIHGFITLGGVLSAAGRVLDKIATTLRAAFEP
jgi:acetyl esterase